MVIKNLVFARRPEFSLPERIHSRHNLARKSVMVNHIMTVVAWVRFSRDDE